MSRISTVIGDDHSLFRAGVVQALQLDSSIKVIGEGKSAPEAVDLAKKLHPDIVLLDISMPGNGLNAVGEIAALPGNTRVVMLTVSEDDDHIMAALEAGAVGYILKGIEADQLISAVKAVAAGDTFVSPNLAARLIVGIKEKTKRQVLETLTKQERRILQLVSTGLSNREVGEKLGILEKTVKFHMSRILAKLKVRNRMEASLLAQKEWLDESSHRL